MSYTDIMKNILSISTESKTKSNGQIYQDQLLTYISKNNADNSTWKRMDTDTASKWLEDEYLFLETKFDNNKLYHKVITVKGKYVNSDKFNTDSSYAKSVFDELTDVGQTGIYALEILSIVKYSHPNLASLIEMEEFFIYDTFASNVVYFTHMTLPYYGKDMSEVDLSSSDISQCVRIAGYLYDGLDHLHNKVFIAHTDIKPGNICLSDDHLHATIIDFGSCLLLRQQMVKEKYSTLHGTRVRNTFGYCSPSQFVAFLFGMEEEGDVCTSDLKKLMGSVYFTARAEIKRCIVERYKNMFTFMGDVLFETRETAEENDLFCLSLCVFEMLSGGVHFFTKRRNFSHNKTDLCSVCNNVVCYFQDPGSYVRDMCKTYIRSYDKIRETPVVQQMSSCLSALTRFTEDEDILAIVGDEWDMDE